MTSTYSTRQLDGRRRPDHGGSRSHRRSVSRERSIVYIGNKPDCAIVRRSIDRYLDVL